jgi:hypothetical protein
VRQAARPSNPATAEEIDRLTTLFHDKLAAAMADRDAADGHA